MSLLIDDMKTLLKTAKDLTRKELVPKHTLSFFQDKKMLRAALSEYRRSPFKEFSCPECGINIQAPKTWVIQHVKYHHMKTDSKENEPKIGKVNPYFK